MEEIREVAQYVIESGCTVREAAEVFGISKSTVHKMLTKQLFFVSPLLYGMAAEGLKKNKDERHMRGGLATKRKYESMKKKQCSS